MNPLTNMKNVLKLSEQELYTGNKTSWHDQYRNSAWIFVGGLPFDLTEGDIICIFSQYGEIVNINLVRAKDTGKSKGFCFICYEDQRSTVLAVDNFNGIKIMNRTVRVDHVNDYKAPKIGKKTDEDTEKLISEGCAPKSVVPVLPARPKTPPQDFRETIADTIQADIKLPQRLPIYTGVSIKQEPVDEDQVKVKKEKKEKKKKKDKKKKSKKSKKEDSSENSDDSTDSEYEKKKSKKKKSKESDGESSSEGNGESRQKQDMSNYANSWNRGRSDYRDDRRYDLNKRREERGYRDQNRQDKYNKTSDRRRDYRRSRSRSTDRRDGYKGYPQSSRNKY